MSDADVLAARVARAMLEAEGAGPAWGVEIEEARLNYVRIAMRLTPEMMNGHGTAHGGMLFALADSALAYASNSSNERAVLAHASMVFFSPGQLGERLVAEAHLRSVSGRSQVYAITVTGGDGRAVGEFTGHTRTIGGKIIEDL